MVVDRALRGLVQTHARSEDLQRCALSAGMRTLRQDRIEKVLAGLTTIEEVRATSNVWSPWLTSLASPRGSSGLGRPRRWPLAPRSLR